MTFRKAIFWIHLAAGIVSGLSIAVMCVTGTVLAFEKEIVGWAERDARRIEVPTTPELPRLSIEEMQRKVREAQPDARPNSLVFQNAPTAAVAFPTGRSGALYLNPYTGEVRQPKSTAVSAFMRSMTDLHRVLGLTGDTGRPRGKLINGVCNIAFCALALTGLYLWMPRTWSWRSLRPIVWFRQNASSRARDFNWHNAIGFWSAPVLIVLTLTAIPISFRWGGTVIAALTGTEAAPGAGAGAGAGAGGPAGPAGGGGPGAAPAVAVPAPLPGTPLLTPDALLAIVQQQVPDWKTITLRTGAGVGAGAAPSSARQPQRAEGSGGGEDRGARGGRAGRGSREGGGRAGGGEARVEDGAARRRPPAASDAAGDAVAPAASFTVRQTSSWPRTASTTLLLNPYTGQVLRRTGYADMNAAQQVRSWTRFLHTGEALGWPGQLVAGLACLGGGFLVYTGFALTWRRFFGGRGNKRRATSAPPSAAIGTPGSSAATGSMRSSP